MTRAWLLRRLVGDGRRHGVAWLALALAFSIVGGAAVGARLVTRAGTPVAPATEARVIAYLEDGLDAAAAAALSRALATLPGVEAVRTVSAREGLELLRRELGARAGVIEGVGPDLLSPSLEIVARPAEASALAFRLRRVRGVADVDLVAAPPGPPLAARAEGPVTRAPVALAGALGLLALFGVLAWLRARLRLELGLWFTLGLPRAASGRPAVWLATAAGGFGAVAGLLGASWASRAWLAAGALPARELAAGAAGLLVVAFLASRVALRVPMGARAS